MDLKVYLNLDRSKIEKSLASKTGLSKLSESLDSIDLNSSVDYWYNIFKFEPGRNALELVFLKKRLRR